MLQNQLNESMYTQAYNVRQAAVLMNKSESTVRRMIKSGKLPAQIIQGNGGEQFLIAHESLPMHILSLSRTGSETDPAAVVSIPEQGNVTCPASDFSFDEDMSAAAPECHSVPERHADSESHSKILSASQEHPQIPKDLQTALTRLKPSQAAYTTKHEIIMQIEHDMLTFQDGLSEFHQISQNSKIFKKSPKEAPEYAKELARTKFELVQKWKDFRYAKEEQNIYFGYTEEQEAEENLAKNSQIYQTATSQSYPEKQEMIAHLYDELRTPSKTKKTRVSASSRLGLRTFAQGAQSSKEISSFIKDTKITVKTLAEIMNIPLRTAQDRCKKGKYKTQTVNANGGEQYVIYVSSLPEDIQLKFFNKNKALITNRGKKISKDAEFVELYNTGSYLPEIYKVLGSVSAPTLRRWSTTLGKRNDYTRLIAGYNYNLGAYKTQLSEEELTTFRQIILSQNKFNVAKAVAWTKEILRIKNVESPSAYITFKRWADDFRKNHYDQWIFAREGRKAYDDKVKPYIQRDYSKIEVGDIFVADGHRLDFMVKHPFTGKPCRALIVGYQDMKSCALAGFEIMVEENTQCVASALRNAIINFGRIPKICYQDNGKAFKNKFFKGSKTFVETNLVGLFERLGIKSIYSTPYNGKAKPIERFWAEFAMLEKIVPSYVGNCIDNKPAYMQRNEQYHKEIHSDILFTIEETINAVYKWLKIYNSRECPHVKGKTIGEVFNEGKNTGESTGIDANALDELMMIEEIRTLQRNGVRFLGQYYWHEKLHGLKDQVKIKYSLFDVSSILVYTLQGKFLCKAHTQMLVHPAAHIMGDAKDKKTLQDATKRYKKLEKQTLQKLKSASPVNLLDLGINIPTLEEKVIQKQELLSDIPQVIPIKQKPKDYFDLLEYREDYKGAEKKACYFDLL